MILKLKCAQWYPRSIDTFHKGRSKLFRNVFDLRNIEYLKGRCDCQYESYHKVNDTCKPVTCGVGEQYGSDGCIPCSGIGSIVIGNECICRGSYLHPDGICSICPVNFLENDMSNLSDLPGQRELDIPQCIPCEGKYAKVERGICQCSKEGVLMHGDSECVECYGPSSITYLNSSGVCACKPGFVINQSGNRCIPCDGERLIMLYAPYDSQRTSPFSAFDPIF